MPPYPASPAEIIRYAARRYGSAIAVVDHDVSLTFDALFDKIEKLSAGFTKLGIGRGSVVVLSLANSWEWVVTYYAILRVGAIVVPANTMLVGRELDFIVGDSGAGAIIVNADKAADLVPTCKREGVLVISTGISPEGTIPYPSLFEPSPAVGKVDRGEMPLYHGISTICYTSGTTGTPKGAALSHKAVMINTAMTATMHGRSEHDVVVTALPFSHVYGNIVMNSSMLTGAQLIICPRFDAATVLSAIEKFKATLFEGVPTMYYYMMADGLPEQFDLSSLTRCTVGGQTMTLSKMKEVEERLGCRLIELWGMTEIAGLGTTHPLYGQPKLGSIGVPMPFMECRVASFDDPNLTVPNGEPGELMFRGPNTMDSYWQQPEATAEVLRADGWLHSGDIGYRDEDGYLFIVDRKKEMIITAGYNIYPSELERAIAEHEDVEMVAVGSVIDANKGELAKAYIVLRQGSECSSEEIVAFCRERLASYKVPKAVEFVTSLPLTSSGKIKRLELGN